MDDFQTILDRVRPWILRNARPLDFCRWRFCFENPDAGTAARFREDALQALGAYQNGDGGFGHALEPDSWNPGSSPIATWRATEVLHEIGWQDSGHAIVAGILRYLASGADFDAGTWLGEVPGNNDHPHAPWWHYNAATVADWGYNPTAALAGFILLHAASGSPLYEQARAIVTGIANRLSSSEALRDMHEVANVIRMAGYVSQAGALDLYDAGVFQGWLARQVDRLIDRGSEAWRTGYACRPSRFIQSPRSPFFAGNEPAVAEEAAFLLETLPDAGVWPVSWTWGQYGQAFAVAENWWKSDIAIQNLRFLQAFLPA